MSNRFQVLSLTIAIVLISNVANAQSIQINFSDPAQDGISATEAVISAAHQGGGFSATDATWNQFTATTANGDGSAQPLDLIGIGSDLVDTQGNVTSAKIRYSEGLSNIDFSAGFVSGGFNQNEDTGNPGNSGTDGNILYEGVIFSRPGEGGVAFQVSGLAPSDYAMYLYTKESNATLRSFDHSVQLDNDDISSAADGNIKVITAGNNTTAFVEDLNYTRHEFTVTGSENVAIFSSVNNSTEPNEPRDFASIAAIQIVDLSAVGPVCDVDGDGDCDFNETDMDMISDFDIIRSNFFKTGQAKADGDLSADGEVGFVDFRIWKAGFLEMGGSLEALEGISFGVPEPSTAVLWVCACGIGCACRSRRQRA